MLPRKATRLTRPIYPIPDFVKEALIDAYRQRPPYQQNDYIGWISRAKQPQTREKRLSQMLDELAAGNSYMGMKYNAKVKPLGKTPVTDYVKPEALQSLATPANLRLGAEIATDNGVELIEFSPDTVIARVQPKGGVRRTVELHSDKTGLTWKCTCTKSNLFCKHCVAAALIVVKNICGNHSP